MDSLIFTSLFCFLTLFITLSFGFIGASMAKSRDRDPSVWFVICAASNVVGLCALAQSPVVFAPEMDSLEEQPEASLNNAQQIEEIKWMLSKGIKPQKSVEGTRT